MENLRGQALYPDAGGRRFAQVHRVSTSTDGHRFVILALQHFHFCARQQAQAFQKFQKTLVFFLYAEDLGGFSGF